MDVGPETAVLGVLSHTVFRGSHTDNIAGDRVIRTSYAAKKIGKRKVLGSS